MAKKKSQEEEVKPINVFQCGVCKDCGSMELPEFKKHLLEVHKLSPDQIKGKKQMTMHMDGATWFSSNYEWTLESGLTFSQFVQQPRGKNDMMRHG